MTTATKVAELPELPKPDWTAKDGVSEGVYSATQVREFGMVCYQAALARQEADKSAAQLFGISEKLGYMPGELDATAPKVIWLQIDTGSDNAMRDEPWPGADGVTWQDESIGGLEIQYVRADLAAAPPSALVGQEPVAWYLPSEEGYDSCFRDHRTITSCAGNPWTGWIPLYAAPPAAQADEYDRELSAVMPTDFKDWWESPSERPQIAARVIQSLREREDFSWQAAQAVDLEQVRKTLQGIVDADWRKWEDLATADEFVRWAKSRASHALTIIDQQAGKGVSDGI